MKNITRQEKQRTNSFSTAELKKLFFKPHPHSSSKNSPFITPSSSSNSSTDSLSKTPPDTIRKQRLEIDRASIAENTEEPFLTYESFALYPQIWNETGAYLRSLAFFIDVETLLKKPYLSNIEYELLSSRDRLCRTSQHRCGLNLVVKPLVEILLGAYHEYKKEKKIAEKEIPSDLQKECLDHIAKAMGCAVGSLDIGMLTPYDTHSISLKTHPAHSELVHSYYEEHQMQLKTRVNRAFLLFELDNLPEELKKQSCFQHSQELYLKQLEKCKKAYEKYDHLLRELKKDPAYATYSNTQISGAYISQETFCEKWRAVIVSQLKKNYGLFFDESTTNKLNTLLNDLSVQIKQLLLPTSNATSIYFKHEDALNTFISQLTKSLFLNELPNASKAQKHFEQKFNAKASAYEKTLKETVFKTMSEQEVDFSAPIPMTERVFEYLHYPTPEIKALLPHLSNNSNHRNSVVESLNLEKNSSKKNTQKIRGIFNTKKKEPTIKERKMFRRSLSMSALPTKQ